MPIFEFDMRARREEREKAAKLAEARALLRGAVASQGAIPPAPSPFLGVTDEIGGVGEDANLEALVRNEEARKRSAAARGDATADLTDAMFSARAAGIDTKPIIESVEMIRKRQELEDLFRGGELTGAGYADALNAKETSPFRFDTNGIGNRYTGEYRSTPAGAALAGERTQAGLKEQALAGSADALADYRSQQARGEQFRNQAIEDILSEPTSPLVAADIVNRKEVGAPQRVRVRLRDGSEQIMNAIPNRAGGFDYTPAAVGTEALVSAPDVTGSKQTPLQKDTAFIAETLGLQPNQALLYKLQSARRSNEEAWGDLVGRLVTANKYAKPDQIQTKAAELWAVMRPGQPLPTAASAGAAPALGPAGAVDTAQVEEDDARARAEAEGYQNFGRWVPGRGLEVLDDAGTVVGHYN